MSTPDDVRELALALPETIERSSYGTPGFRVGDRLFARLHQDGESLVVWVDMDEREMLAQTEPGEVLLDAPLREAPDAAGAARGSRPRPELAEVLRDSWRQRAPGAVLRKFGDGSSEG